MKQIRLSKCSTNEEEKKAVCKILDNEYLGMGPEVVKFEEDIKQFLELKDREVVCVNSGTSALQLALSVLGIGYDDEVLVPSLTFVASYQAISAVGAKPISCDVKDENLLMDSADVEKRITSKTKAIMPVHYASNPDGMEEIYKIAKKYNLRVVEDAAHSFGSIVGKNYVGSKGDIICFSFDGIKNITSGEGGAIITSDLDLVDKMRDSRLLGVIKDSDKRASGKRSWNFDVTTQGYRFHMSDIMAAIGRVQLKKLPDFAKKRKNLCTHYNHKLTNIQNIQLLLKSVNDVCPHIFVIRVRNNHRKGLIKYLNDKGIQTGIHYNANHLLTYYKTNYQLPITEKASKEILTLPLHVDMDIEDVDYIVTKIEEYFEKNI